LCPIIAKKWSLEMRLQVVKANKLVQAGYTLSLVEQRIVLLAIIAKRENQQISSDGMLTIHAKNYADAFNVSKQAAQKALAESVENLFARKVTIEYFDEELNKKIPLTIRWINAMTYLENEASIKMRFNQEIVDEFTRLESNFTSYMLENIKDLNSAYSIRLYELLMQYKNLEKTPIIEITKFRQIMGLGDKEYQGINDFKKRVLELALKQINTQTDLTVTYEQIKSGRTITGFIFKMQSKAIEPPKPTPKPKKPKAAAKAAAPVGALAGIDKAVFNDLKKSYPTLTEQYIFDLANKNNDSTFDTLQKMQQAQRDGNFSLELTD
jgi:plasmid replication initiation protein